MGNKYAFHVFSCSLESNIIVTYEIKRARDKFLTLFQFIIGVDKAIDLDATFTMDELLKAMKGFEKAKLLVGMVLL